MPKKKKYIKIKNKNEKNKKGSIYKRVVFPTLSNIYDVTITSLNTEVAVIQKPVNLFTLQIK